MSYKRYGTAALLTAASAGGAFMLGSGPVQAQGSARQMLEEVVVTARRREESLQDLPLSIAAFSADQLEAQGIQNIEDVADFVPNVQLMQGDRANNTRIVIRGIGGGHPDPVFVFGSGMYIDGHYIPNSLGGYMSTIDIERIEVLRGPQGTLFGKNVTGGAVNIISAKPGPDYESSINLRLAEQGQQDIRGNINFPITDTLFARVGLASEQFDGYYYNRHLNVDVGGTDAVTFNTALRWQPNDNWTFDVNTFLIRRRDGNLGIQCNPFDGSAPQWGGGAGNIERLYPGARDDYYETCAEDASISAFVNTSNKMTFANIDQQSIMASAAWDSNGPVGGLQNLSVRMNASYRGNDYDYMQDRDASFLDIDAVGTFAGRGDIGQDNWTRGSEFIVEAQVNDRLEFTAGVNYFYEKAKNGDGRCREVWVSDPANTAIAFDDDGVAITDDDGVTAANPGREYECDSVSGLYFELLPAPRAMGGSPAFINQNRVENEALGVFGHLTYAINDNWDFDFGVRYTRDDREFWNMEGPNGNCNSGVATPGAQTLGNPTTTGFTALCIMDTIPINFVNTVQTGFLNEASDTFSATTPMFSFTRNLAPGDRLDSGMVYFLYSEGFLTGGFNPEVNANLPGIEGLLTYQPEDVTNYEIGFKGTYAGGRLQIMADVFYMDYGNRQNSINIPNPPLPGKNIGLYGIDDPLGVVTNVSSAVISGIEFEMRASPWDGGFVSLDIGVLSNEYDEYSFADPEGGPGTIDLSENIIVDLMPGYTVNLGVEHTFTLASGASLTPRMTIYASDDIEFFDRLRSDPPTPCNQDAWTKVAARMTYVPAAGNWTATVFGNNLTDELIYESCIASRGVYRYRHERPRWWGVEFTTRFGG